MFPLHPFSTVMKTSENHKVFWCFQEVEKGCIGNELVKANFFWNLVFISFQNSWRMQLEYWLIAHLKLVSMLHANILIPCIYGSIQLCQFSISVLGKYTPMQAVKQPVNGRASNIKEQSFSSFQANYDLCNSKILQARSTWYKQPH